MTAKNNIKILIVDDVEINRAILGGMLEDKFNIIEASNGREAIEVLEKYGDDISLVLLDNVMPEMDGFEVLAMMNRHKWIEDIPVIMISAESSNSYMDRAYELGVRDFIGRPFIKGVVNHRIMNAIELHAKQKNMMALLAEKIKQRENHDNTMVSILSYIVEFRNGESGLHIFNVEVFTRLLLTKLLEKTDKYDIKPEDLPIICKASTLHDIGKITVSKEILDKPGRLNDSEIEELKGHSIAGATMLRDIPFNGDKKTLGLCP